MLKFVDRHASTPFRMLGLTVENLGGARRIISVEGAGSGINVIVRALDSEYYHSTIRIQDSLSQYNMPYYVSSDGQFSDDIRVLNGNYHWQEEVQPSVVKTAIQIKGIFDSIAVVTHDNSRGTTFTLNTEVKAVQVTEDFVNLFHSLRMVNSNLCYEHNKI